MNSTFELFQLLNSGAAGGADPQQHPRLSAANPHQPRAARTPDVRHRAAGRLRRDPQRAVRNGAGEMAGDMRRAAPKAETGGIFFFVIQYIFLHI